MMPAPSSQCHLNTTQRKIKPISVQRMNRVFPRRHLQNIPIVRQTDKHLIILPFWYLWKDCQLCKDCSPSDQTVGSPLSVLVLKCHEVDEQIPQDAGICSPLFIDASPSMHPIQEKEHIPPGRTAPAQAQTTPTSPYMADSSEKAHS